MLGSLAARDRMTLQGARANEGHEQEWGRRWVQPWTVACDSWAPRRSLAALTVLLMSMAMVSLPTPPGTGVQAPAMRVTRGIAIADDGASLFGELLFALLVALEKTLEEDRVGDVIDADIEDGCAGLDELGGDETGTSDGGDEDVSATADGGQVLGAGVADGDGCAGVEQQHGQRTTDDIAAADDDGLLAFDGNVGAAQDLHASGRGAGDEAGTLGAEIADVGGVEAVDILIRRDGEQDALGIDVGGQRKLDENAIDFIAGIELLDEGDEFVGGRSLRGR